MTKSGGGSDISTQKLTVPYVVFSIYNEQLNRNLRTRLLGRGPNPGGYTIIYGESMWNNVPAREAFRRALGKWRCASGVNITEMCNTHDVCKIRNKTLPGVIRVDFKNECMGIAEHPNAATGNNLLLLIQNGDTIYINHNATITFDPNTNWVYNGYAHGTAENFEHNALHELGHFQLNQHVNEETLMSGGGFVFGDDLDNIVNITNDPARRGAKAVVDFSTTAFSPTNAYAYKPMLPVAPDSCALDTCSISQTNCTDPNYPLYAYFALVPELCLDDPTYDNISWYNTVGTDVSIVAKEGALGEIVDYSWTVDTDDATFGNQPCDFSSASDTCRALFWTVPGEKNIQLTVTDANGCTSSYEQTVTVVPDCTTPLPITTDSRRICNTNFLGCGSSDRNIQLLIEDISQTEGSGCFRYYIYYHSTDETVSTYEEFYTETDLVRNESSNSRLLNCLKEGYYRIDVMDEVTTCHGETIVHLSTPAPTYPIINQYVVSNDAGCSSCTGSISLLEVNNNTDLSNYTFAWSACSPPESCNVTTVENLCAGLYNITALDTTTGCSGTVNINVNYNISSGGGLVTGINIDVNPTVYTDIADVRLTLPQAGEVTVEVYNLNGVLLEKLVDKVFYSQGEFTIPHNATNLNNGIYLYRLKVCDMVRSDVGVKQ